MRRTVSDDRPYRDPKANESAIRAYKLHENARKKLPGDGEDPPPSIFFISLLDEIDATLRDHPVDLAINIHSFSECRIQAIEWWARLLSKHCVKNLMIAPNGTGESAYKRLFTNDGQDFLPILEHYGYRTVLKEPKFIDPVVQEYGLLPTWYHLLELRT